MEGKKIYMYKGIFLVRGFSFEKMFAFGNVVECIIGYEYIMMYVIFLYLNFNNFFVNKKNYIILVRKNIF